VFELFGRGEIEEAKQMATAALDRPSLSELARDGTDFDALRGDARFEALVGAPVAS
jgi:hypothetical protein